VETVTAQSTEDVPAPLSSSETEKIAAQQKATHQDLDYGKWDKVDWDAPDPEPQQAVRKRPAPSGRDGGAAGAPQDALRGILEMLLPQILSPFAVQKLDKDGKGFLMLKCSHILEDFALKPPQPEMNRKFSVRYCPGETAEDFLLKMGASAVAPTVVQYIGSYEPREELVLVVACPAETGKGSNVSTLRLALRPSFDECLKRVPFTMDVLQIDYDKVESDERAGAAGGKKAL